MIFKKKDQLVGLDIGSSSIKVAEFSETKNKSVLKKFGMIPVAPGTISEGRVKDMEGLAETIRELFKSQKIKNKNVAISTGGQSVVIKTISTSKMPDADIQKSIYEEAEQYIPYDIDEVNLDYQVLGESEFYEDQLNVLLVAVKKDLVAEYIDLISLAGLVPKIIDVDTFALQNLYGVHAHSETDKVVMLVDVGASKTSLNILKNGQSVLMRDNVLGVNQIVNEMAQQFDMDMPDAERLYRNRSEWSDYGGAVEDICNQVVATWCSEIAEVVHTFQSGGNEAQLDRVYVSGGGIYVNGFSDQLTSDLGTPVARLEPFNGLEIDENAFTPEFISEVGPQASIALGLALRRVDDK